MYGVEILKNKEQKLSLRIYADYNDVEVVITLVYAKCSLEERIQLSEQLYEFYMDYQKPWLMGGDLNVILNEEEKMGGLPITVDEVRDFNH